MSEFLTVAEARERLVAKGVKLPPGPCGVYALIRRGKLPHIRLNRIYVTGLDAFLAQQAQASTEVASPQPVPTQSVSRERVAPALTLANPKRRRFGTPERERRATS